MCHSEGQSDFTVSVICGVGGSRMTTYCINPVPQNIGIQGSFRVPWCCYAHKRVLSFLARSNAAFALALALALVAILVLGQFIATLGSCIHVYVHITTCTYGSVRTVLWQLEERLRSQLESAIGQSFELARLWVAQGTSRNKSPGPWAMAACPAPLRHVESGCNSPYAVTTSRSCRGDLISGAPSRLPSLRHLNGPDEIARRRGCCMQTHCQSAVIWLQQNGSLPFRRHTRIGNLFTRPSSGLDAQATAHARLRHRKSPRLRWGRLLISGACMLGSTEYGSVVRNEFHHFGETMPCPYNGAEVMNWMHAVSKANNTPATEPGHVIGSPQSVADICLPVRFSQKGPSSVVRGGRHNNNRCTNGHTDRRFSPKQLRLHAVQDQCRYLVAAREHHGNHD